MKYFIDFEFLEGDIPVKFLGCNIPKWLIKPSNTIQPISVGLVSSDGREYYAISKDFNLKEAWNRYDLKPNEELSKISPELRQQKLYNSYYNSKLGYEKVYWLRDNVLLPIYKEHIFGDMRNKFPFTYNTMKWILKNYGKYNNQIAKEIKHFVANRHIKANKEQWILDYDTKDIQFYGYYSDYDWVVFCWLFGRMIDLPNGFPMYCIDLKQTLDNKKHECSKDIDLWGKDIKDHPNYPKQTNEHNALSDAKWTYELYKFLNTL